MLSQQKRFLTWTLWAIDQYSELYVSTRSVADPGEGPGRPAPPRPTPFLSGVGVPPPPPPLILRSGSATAHLNECESGSFFIRKKNNKAFWLHLMEDWFINIIW